MSASEELSVFPIPKKRDVFAAIRELLALPSDACYTPREDLLEGKLRSNLLLNPLRALRAGIGRRVYEEGLTLPDI